MSVKIYILSWEGVLSSNIVADVLNIDCGNKAVMPSSCHFTSLFTLSGMEGKANYILNFRFGELSARF